MDASFIPIEVVPSKTPFGLDQLRRSYKTSLSAEVAISVCPPVGTADETFQFMFLMPVNTPESAESATRIDLVYMGCLQPGDDGPGLPDPRNELNTTVQSATSSRADDGRTANPPISVQFYAPTSTLSYISYLSPGGNSAPEPSSGDLKIITVTISDQAIRIGAGDLNGMIDAFFDVQTLETTQATEIVPGKYYQNVSTKITSYTAFVFSLEPGAYLFLNSPGTGYLPSDALTVADGGESAAVTVVTVGIGGSITAFSVGANDFTVSHDSIAASGGSGTGATFGVTIVT